MDNDAKLIQCEQDRENQHTNYDEDNNVQLED